MKKSRTRPSVAIVAESVVGCAVAVWLAEIPVVITAHETPREEQLPGSAPALAIAPFDAAQAKRHQEAWAAYLGVPVEVTNSIGMKLVLIPPGEFLMGSSESNNDAARNQEPQREVRITRPFFLGKCEVTQKQYQHVMGSNPSNSSGAQFPVEQVTWNDAVKFCESLSLRPEEKVASALATGSADGFACAPGPSWRDATECLGAL